MSAIASAFSSSDTDVLERGVDSGDVDHEAAVTLEQIWNETHKKVCAGWIKHNGYKRVCLQFPDQYLKYSNAISDSLKTLLTSGNGNSEKMDNTKVFILADTSYGSCCVDEIAAAHVDADSIIHFGNACRSKISRLPVLYMFAELSFDLSHFLQHLTLLKATVEDKDVCIYLDIGYHHLFDQNVDSTHDECFNSKIQQSLPCKQLHIETYPPAEDDKNDSLANNDERICIFVGADNSRFFNLSLTTKAAQWFIYEPTANTLNQKNPLTANYIRRRYYYIEKCKDAQTLGLIVATLTADGYLEVVARLQEMAKSRGIKTQIISVGRINPAKLANFLEIDCFVLIGCPFNNMYTSKEYYKPIVSVFEAEMALNPAWHMKYPEAYVTDFKQLLPAGRDFLPFDREQITEQDVSLVSGRLRNANIEAASAVELANVAALSEQQQALATQPGMEVMTTNTGLTFEDRTWKGLDPALGCNEPAKLQKGLSGIPIKYSHD